MDIDHFSALEKAWLARVKGFSSYPRQELFLARFGLTDAEYILLRLIKDIAADWDSKHAKYELFVFEHRQISFYTGWSKDKVYTTFRSLKQKGFVVLEDSGQKLYRVTELHLFKSMRDFKTLEEHHLNYLSEYIQKIIAKVQLGVAETPLELLNLQLKVCKFITGKDDSVAKSSFSSKSKVFVESNEVKPRDVLTEDIDPDEIARLMDT